MNELSKIKARAREKLWRAANKEKVRATNLKNNAARSARYRARNRAQFLLSQANYYKRNIDSIREKQTQYRLSNDAHKIANNKWMINNRHIKRASTAKRRARLRNATVAWANPQKIRMVYEEADRVTKETGVAHVVDHIIPLAGTNVCGLHWEENLQVITAIRNGHKGNKWVID